MNDLKYYHHIFRHYVTKTVEVIIDKTKPQWHDYFLSGYKGILDKFNLEKGKGKQ